MRRRTVGVPGEADREVDVGCEVEAPRLMFIRQVAVGFAAVAMSLYGQARPKDIDGWDKIKWGMTIAEAASTYGIAAQPETKDNWTLLQLNPAKIAGVEMGVQVGARESAGKISLVRLWSFFGLPSSPPSASAQDFDTLRTLLIQKYGPPANEETRRGENFRLMKRISWKFPSTSILMSLEQSASLPNLGTIYLDYTATAP
jgi:hypothetical protein